MALGAAVIYVTTLLALTLLPLNDDPSNEIIFRLTPLATIGRAVRLGPGSYEYGIMILNVLAFVPVGLLVPILTRSRSLLIAVGAGFLLSLAIEIAQYVGSLALGYSYRRADIDDIITNTIGALLGFTIYFVLDFFAAQVRESDR